MRFACESEVHVCLRVVMHGILVMEQRASLMVSAPRTVTDRAQRGKNRPSSAAEPRACTRFDICTYAITYRHL